MDTRWQLRAMVYNLEVKDYEITSEVILSIDGTYKEFVSKANENYDLVSSGPDGEIWSLATRKDLPVVAKTVYTPYVPFINSLLCGSSF